MSVTRVIETFRRIDSNHSGFVDKSGLFDVIRQVSGLQGSELEQLSREVEQALLASNAQRGDSVDYNTFLRFLFPSDEATGRNQLVELKADDVSPGPISESAGETFSVACASLLETLEHGDQRMLREAYKQFEHFDEAMLAECAPAIVAFLERGTSGGAHLEGKALAKLEPMALAKHVPSLVKILCDCVWALEPDHDSARQPSNDTINARYRFGNVCIALSRVETSPMTDHTASLVELLKLKQTHGKVWDVGIMAVGLAKILNKVDQATLAQHSDTLIELLREGAIVGAAVLALSRLEEDVLAKMPLKDHVPEILDLVVRDSDAEVQHAACRILQRIDSTALSGHALPIPKGKHVAGFAPIAPRPTWLPRSGKGQAHVDPLCWSISVEQWIFFLRACVATDTWTALVNIKGEYAITMYDINEHFVKPWTAGTGCSIALLMNQDAQPPVECMLSHAWAGSVVETYNCLQNMVNHNGVPSTARLFYCVYSLYQPQDGATGGLSISQQLKLEPFAKIIESKPVHGMFVLHTTLSEVYGRLWVVHEADVGVDAGLQIRGLFDMYRWTLQKFDVAAAVKTIEGKCGVPEDRMYIDTLIKKRGGYERLDARIHDFRDKMRVQLAQFLQQQEQAEPKLNSWNFLDEPVKKRVMDWQKLSGNLGDYDVDDTSWLHEEVWEIAMGRVCSQFGISEVQKNDYITKIQIHSISVDNRDAMPFPYQAFPLGSASFPLGESKRNYDMHVLVW